MASRQDKVVGIGLTVTLIMLCVLAFLDLWRQAAFTAERQLLDNYRGFVESSDSSWSLGWQLEDLEHRSTGLRSTLSKVMSVARRRWGLGGRGVAGEAERARILRSGLYEAVVNDSSLFQIRCSIESPYYLQVGLNSFRSDARDSCQLFTSVVDEPLPENLFSKVDLGDGAFALRSFGSGLFVKAVPPPSDGITLPWKLVVAAATPGAAEHFRMSSEGYLYSPLLGGFFHCSGQGDMVKGFAGEYADRDSFVLVPAAPAAQRKARRLAALSASVSATQRRAVERHLKKRDPSEYRPPSKSEAVTIAVTVPVTSRGTDMVSVRNSPLWPNLFRTMVGTLDWARFQHRIVLYLGFDRGDNIYDVGYAFRELEETFRTEATNLLRDSVSSMKLERILKEQLVLKLNDFDGLQGAPSQIVSRLASRAVQDGADYVYQVNDDTTIVTPNWADELIDALRKDPLRPNFGVTGPIDTNNEKIFTHAFVHRTHVEIFDGFFPASFKNWWSDDWISTVYGESHTHKPKVYITHMVGSQKTSSTTRYQVDHSAQARLEAEIMLGHVKINNWLDEKRLPRLPLPDVCGYTPAVSVLDGELSRRMEAGGDHGS